MWVTSMLLILWVSGGGLGVEVGEQSFSEWRAGQDPRAGQARHFGGVRGQCVQRIVDGGVCAIYTMLGFTGPTHSSAAGKKGSSKGRTEQDQVRIKTATLRRLDLIQKAVRTLKSLRKERDLISLSWFWDCLEKVLRKKKGSSETIRSWRGVNGTGLVLEAESQDWTNRREKGGAGDGSQFWLEPLGGWVVPLTKVRERWGGEKAELLGGVWTGQQADRSPWRCGQRK